MARTGWIACALLAVAAAFLLRAPRHPALRPDAAADEDQAPDGTPLERYAG